MNISYGIDFDFSITWEEMGKQKRIGLLNTDSYPPTLFLEAAYNSIFVLGIAIWWKGWNGWGMCNAMEGTEKLTGFWSEKYKKKATSKTWSGWYDNIKKGTKETGWWWLWTDLSLDRNKRHAVVNVQKIFGFHKLSGFSWPVKKVLNELWPYWVRDGAKWKRSHRSLKATLQNPNISLKHLQHVSIY